MNLLDKKLKDKLKLFEDIDKQLTNPNSKQISTKTSHTNTKPSIPQKVLKPKSEQFDQIYCNFLLNQSSNKRSIPYTTPPNRLMKYTNKQTTKSNTPSCSTSISKQKNTTPPNNSGERLYNYGFYIKNKHERKRIEEEEKIHKQMTPKILPRSKSIERDSKFEERLYYNNNSNNISKVSNDNCDTQSIYHSRKTNKELMDYNYYAHKPSLDKNSMLIASKLEPSSSRLLKKKKKYYKNDNSLSPKINSNKNGLYSNSNNNSNSFYNTSQSHKSTTKSKRCNELYAKGVEKIQKREKAYKDHKKKEEEEYKQYSFKPKIIKNSPLIDNSIVKSVSTGNEGAEMYKKQFEWKKKVENENIRKKKKIENMNYQDCTFKPEISHLNIQNDEKFIMKNIDQMNEYVNKRREFIQKKKEFEEYKNKRLGHSSSNFTLKPTIPKEFSLHTANRSHSRSKSKDNQRRDELIQNKNCLYINNNIDKDRKYYNNNNQYQDYYQSGQFSMTNSNNNINSQEAFIKAVNDLHCRIDNLNI